MSGLYRGIASPLVGVTPMFALSFWSYGMGQKAIYALTPGRSSTTELSLAEYAAAGIYHSPFLSTKTHTKARYRLFRLRL
jgi:solute carrier family 25 carnitine/acylcarnitine transporter 20/29